MVSDSRIKQALVAAAEQLENEDPYFDCMDNIVADKLREALIDMKKTKRPYAQPEAGRKNVYMDRDTLKRLKDIGDGNVSAGIRIAAKAYKG